MGFGQSKRRKNSKPGRTTLRAYHFRLETNTAQFSKLQGILDLACELKNEQVVLLENSRIKARAAKLRGEEPHYLSTSDLQASVSKINLSPKFLALHSQVRQNLCHRVIEGQQRWFEALKEGRRHVRPPSSMRRKDFRSITFSQYGSAAKITHGKLHLSKIGEFRVVGWRKMRGAKKSLTVKFKEGHFWAIVMCEIQEADQCRPYKDLAALPEAGFDPGLSSVLTDSLGTSYDTPKPLKVAQAKLRHIQKDVSRKFETRKAQHLQVLAKARETARARGDHKAALAPVASGLVESLRLIPYSNRLKANIKKLAKAHTKVERIRSDVARKNARKIEKQFRRIAIEDHGLNFMLKNRRLARTCSDVAIGKQKQALHNALGSGRVFLTANRRPEGGNSQTCLCGESVPKELKDRWHHCPACGLQGPRDQISAIIVQHTQFGSVPALPVNGQVRNDKDYSKECVPGPGILERAVKALETRRREGKSGGGESRAVESHTAASGVKPRAAVQSVEAVKKLAAKAAASELSVKRPTRRKRKAGKTTGEAKAANVEVKTMGHADVVGPCLIATKDPVQIKRFPIVNGSASPGEKHTRSRG